MPSAALALIQRNAVPALRLRPSGAPCRRRVHPRDLPRKRRAVPDVLAAACGCRGAGSDWRHGDRHAPGAVSAGARGGDGVARPPGRTLRVRGSQAGAGEAGAGDVGGCAAGFAWAGGGDGRCGGGRRHGHGQAQHPH